MASTSFSAPNDDLESLLNYNTDRPETANNAEESHNTTTNTSVAQNTSIGVDEEVKIAKKRQPVPKLDYARLVSPAGIPRLRKIHKDRLRLKGKGHEFSDVARLLNLYQLWLDDLYPRAKFADALVLAEKEGHSKKMQMMRKQWIDEGKPKLSTADDDEGEVELAVNDMGDHAIEDGIRSPDAELNTMQDAMMFDRHEAQNADGPREVPKTASGAGEPDMDELDALLEEDAARTSAAALTAPGTSNAGVAQKMQNRSWAESEQDEFADEMDAMAGMDVPW